MADYITAHHGGGWKYQFHIPLKLRPMLGRTAFVRYLKRMPRREAGALARAYALEDAARLAVCQEAPEHLRSGLASVGGLLPLLSNSDIPSSVLDERYKKLPDNQLFWQRLAAEAIQDRVDRKLGKTAEQALSWDRLFAEWKRIKEPKKTRLHAATIGLLKEYFGERDCREITPSEIGEFRDRLTKTNNSRIVVTARLKHIGAMFSAASKEPTSPFAGMANPAKGVSLLGKSAPLKDGKNKAFGPSQVRIILETAAAVRFGGNRHEEVLWVLRLLAFTGARPSEICQLQAGDVLEQDGVRLLYIQETDAVTGKRHPQKSIKTGEPRPVPLHPMVVDFFEHAQKFSKGDFIFGKFTWNKGSGWVGWLTSYFTKFLENDCRIAEPQKRLTLDGLRHAFHDAMDVANVPEKSQKRIVGHGKDTHARYGGGDLKGLADWMAKVKPTGECADIVAGAYDQHFYRDA